MTREVCAYKSTWVSEHVLIKARKRYTHRCSSPSMDLAPKAPGGRTTLRTKLPKNMKKKNHKINQRKKSKKIHVYFTIKMRFFIIYKYFMH